ncbi:MAG: hypothetical protein ACOH2H_06965 [Cypionkella sp.]
MQGAFWIGTMAFDAGQGAGAEVWLDLTQEDPSTNGAIPEAEGNV